VRIVSLYSAFAERHEQAVLPRGHSNHKEQAMSENNAADRDQDQLRIDVQDESALREWSKKLDATPEELKEAVAAVGDLASDVELHLKGSRSSVNSERVHNAL
jgi:hypothetical protein